jgi:signal transduction histidine kinase
VLAVTTLVVVAFVIPLSVLVVRQADQRARSQAERDTQTVAAILVSVLATAEGVPDAEEVSDALGPLPDGIGVVLPGDGGSIGTPADPALVARAVIERTAVSAYTDAGWELAFPVVLREGTAAVTAVVGHDLLREGVVPAITMLVLLGVGLVAVSLVLADRLGDLLVAPMTSLAGAARRLGTGDLDVRVHVDEPEEAVEVAHAFNELATRLGDLIAAEREAVADLSHRLRTPLTVLRLQVDAVEDPEMRRSMADAVDRMEREVDRIIAEARRPVEGRSHCDLVEVVADRAQFWQVLSEEERRTFSVDLPDGPVPVGVSEHELGVALDALVGNVFDHTPPGTAFSLRVEAHPGPRLLVRDEGPGFPRGLDPVERGASASGSTGLGLDIARRVAERAGGGLDATNAPEGGALVVMRLSA